MNFEDSDEEYEKNKIRPKLLQWNNWIPKNESINNNIIPGTVSRRPEHNSGQKYTLQMVTPKDIKEGVASSFLGSTNARTEIKLIRKRNERFSFDKTKADTSFCTEEISEKPGIIPLARNECSSLKYDSSDNEPEKMCDINKDWGKRTELHNILQVNAQNIWNVIGRGIFAEIKLWKNEYGNICCKASGKVSVNGVINSLIEINTEQNLRKLLNLSNMQWSALCEKIHEKNCTLSFNAFHDVDLRKMSPIEKLWFFICKRRHFLPNICVLVKLSGAVKRLKELRIIPRLHVMEIRDFKGEEIS